MCAALQKGVSKKELERLADFLPFAATIDNEGDNVLSYISNYSNANCQPLVEYLLGKADPVQVKMCVLSPAVDISPSSGKTRERNRQLLRAFVLRVRMEQEVAPFVKPASFLRKI